MRLRRRHRVRATEGEHGVDRLVLLQLARDGALHARHVLAVDVEVLRLRELALHTGAAVGVACFTMARSAVGAAVNAIVLVSTLSAASAVVLVTVAVLLT